MQAVGLTLGRLQQACGRRRESHLRGASLRPRPARQRLPHIAGETLRIAADPQNHLRDHPVRLLQQSQQQMFGLNLRMPVFNR